MDIKFSIKNHLKEDDILRGLFTLKIFVLEVTCLKSN